METGVAWVASVEEAGGACEDGGSPSSPALKGELTSQGG
jgi:hypothetical protein